VEIEVDRGGGGGGGGRGKGHSTVFEHAIVTLEEKRNKNK